MGHRIIISSTHLDMHGEVVTKEALEKAAIDINSEKKARWTIDHKRELPPLGRIDNAEVIQKDDHYFLIVEPLKYEVISNVEWDKDLRMESFGQNVLFAEIANTPSEDLIISLDSSNFSSFEEFERLNSAIYQISNDVKFSMHGRKSEIPVPELILTISKYGILYLLLKPFVEKIGEKLAEDLYDETKKNLQSFKNYLVKVIKLTRFKALPKNKKLVTVMQIPGTPHIELFARTDDIELISKSMTQKNLAAIRDELIRLSAFVEIGKVQFVLNEKGKWKFNYLLTLKGEVIGKKTAFKTRDQLFKKTKFGR
jgi:hypothetical protein